MKDLKVSLNRHCPCSQIDCALLGNCVLCVQNHLEHKRHVPECFQDILRPSVENLSKLLELSPQEGRPEAGHRTEAFQEELIARSMAKHKPKK